MSVESANTAIRPVVKQFVTSDGYVHHFRRWQPGGPPHGQVLALHGMQSHSGWYDQTAQSLAADGWQTDWLDRRGSGLNQADRGHADHADRLIHDIVQLAHHTRRHQPELSSRPRILLGVCWGGKLALATILEYPTVFNGLVLLCPGLHTHIRVRSWHRLALQAGMLLGQQRRVVRIPMDDPSLFSGSTEWQEFIRQDELSLRKATVGLLTSSLHLDDLIRQRQFGAWSGAKSWPPVFCALAGRDRIVDNASTRIALTSGIDEKSATILEYPEAAHTLEFEPAPQPFLSDLKHWLKGISQGKTPATDSQPN